MPILPSQLPLIEKVAGASQCDGCNNQGMSHHNPVLEQLKKGLPNRGIGKNETIFGAA